MPFLLSLALARHSAPAACAGKNRGIWDPIEQSSDGRGTERERETSHGDFVRQLALRVGARAHDRLGVSQGHAGGRELTVDVHVSAAHGDAAQGNPENRRGLG